MICVDISFFARHVNKIRFYSISYFSGDSKSGSRSGSLRKKLLATNELRFNYNGEPGWCYPEIKIYSKGGWFRFVGAGDIKLTPLLEKSFSVILQLSTRRFVGLWGRRDDGIAVISISRPRCKFETLRTARTLTPLLFSLPDTIERRLRLQLLEWRQHRSTSYKIETCPNLLSLHHWFFSTSAQSDHCNVYNKHRTRVWAEVVVRRIEGKHGARFWRRRQVANVTTRAIDAFLITTII